MKNRLPLITFIIALVFIIGGFWTYRTYIKAKMDNISIQTIDVNLKNQEQLFQLVKHSDQSGIFQLELSIEGNSTNNVNIQIGPTENQITSDIRIKKGKIETAYINDWYADSAFVKITSDDNTQGKLTFSYQFIGTDSK